MSLDDLDIKQRIANEIKARALDDSYIDRVEEREIIFIARELGVTSVKSVLAALGQVCDEFGYVMESRAIKQIEDQLAEVAAIGRVSRADFERVCAGAKRALGGKKSDREVQKIVIQVMEATGHNKVRAGWFTNWYAALKKEIGA